MFRFYWIVIAILTNGCALHYYNEETHTEHVWGVGHMMLKVTIPQEDLKATVRGTVLSGVALGMAGKESYLMMGYEKRQVVEIIDSDTAVSLEWPKGDLLNLRIGSRFPTH